MPTIDLEALETMSRDIAALEQEEIEAELKRMADEQPELLGYVVESCEDVGELIAQYSVYLFFFVYRLFERAYGRPIPAIGADEIHSAHDAQVERWSEMEATGDEETLLQELGGQPFISQFILQSLATAAEEAEEEEEDVESEVADSDLTLSYFVLKTVVDLLDRATSGGGLQE